MPKLRHLIVTAFVTILATAPASLLGAGIYAQMVMPFPDERPLTYAYYKSEHALVLTIQKTSPSELPALERYDERLIRRVLVKDLGPAGTEVKLILRDREVRAVVNTFNEPFRIAIDLFDADYAEEKDPQTGLPVGGGKSSAEGSSSYLAATPGGGNAPPHEAGPLRLVSPAASDNAAMPSAADTSNAARTGSRRLMQPLPGLFANTEELQGAMRSAAEGVGKAWKDYPPFIYRLQTAAYEEGLAKERQQTPPPLKNLTSAEAMADYAGKLYNFGHESKALIAYQQVLQRDARIFDQDALHLWKFSEVHFGQGNLTLAHGYYQALVEKHPESPLAPYARIRLLDVEAVRLLQLGRLADWSTLTTALSAVKVRQAGELAALVAIRQAYWDAGGNAKSYSPDRLPDLPPAARPHLAAAYPNVESGKTAFLAASLLLHDRLAPTTPWQRDDGTFANAYFKRFSGQPTEPFRSQLDRALQAKLNQSLQSKVTDGKLLEAIGDFEALPPTLQSVKQTPKTAWALAEAYRKLAQASKAVELYAYATKGEEEGPDRFKAQFWLAVTAGDEAETLKAQSRGGDQIARLSAISAAADRAAATAWSRLKEDERSKIAVAYKEAFEKTITNPTRLKTGPRIVLDNWTKALTTKASTQNGSDASDWGRAFSPSGGAVILLSDLGKRFAELGMPAERRQAIGLLKYMQPKELGDDKAAKQIWANQLAQLAEDYRKTNQYLDAGRLYSMVGDGAENWEGRAEALYKGGLLLYRSGRREEAQQAFKKASEDGNNLFYANLAKERLSQMQQ